MSKNPRQSWRQTILDGTLWSGVGVAFVLEMLATYVHNDLLQWLAFGVIILACVLAITNRRLRRDLFQGQAESITAMMIASLFVAALFSMLAGSFHLALFWWVAGIAFLTCVVLRIILIFQVKSQE